MRPLIIGIDTGGTFTDFVILDENGRLKRWKVLSSPSDPSRAIIEGLREILGDSFGWQMEIVHGTTVGTNAFLERKGARTCLITTRGFEDVLFIGRQARPSLYDLYGQKPRQIIPREMAFGIDERSSADGTVLKALDDKALEECSRFIETSGAKSVAVCLLHSYANPKNEEKIGRHLDRIGVKFCLSSRLLPEFREFERTSTTVINAYLGPVIGEYMKALERRLPQASILVQQSGGGCRPAGQIEEVAVTTILSGPAGGVMAGLELGRSLGISNILTFDMGGTSTDVSVCPGHIVFTRDYQIEGFPINLPVIDVHTVGAGGGSIAWIDKGGLLKVGPRSAGADPGPVCYGKGKEITVTDANLFLGRLKGEKFLGGRMALHEELVEEKMAELGHRLKISPVDAALGIIRLVNTNMVEALRKVSVERGYDPRGFYMVSFGGAAGLHALSVAKELEVARVVIPEMAGVFSAQGLACSDLIFEASTSLFWQSSKGDESEILESAKTLERSLMEEAREFIKCKAGVEKDLFLDARYLGQSFEIMVPYSENWQTLFHREHQRLYGYCLIDETIEVTAIRLKIRVPRQKQEIFPPASSLDRLEKLEKSEAGALAFEFSDIIFDEGKMKVPLVERKDIPDERLLSGPFLITDEFTTVLVLSGWHVAKVGGHLVAMRI